MALEWIDGSMDGYMVKMDRERKKEKGKESEQK